MKILEAVSFVDKTIFGRLNYSVKSSEFRYTKEFYNSLALAVIKFCKKIKLVIILNKELKAKYCVKRKT